MENSNYSKTETCPIISINTGEAVDSLIYNEAGKVIQINSNVDGYKIVTNYTYLDNRITINSQLKDGKSIINKKSIEYILDNKKRIIKRYDSSHSNTYAYNSNDQLISIISESDDIYSQIHYINNSISEINHKNLNESITFKLDENKTYVPYSMFFLSAFSDNADDPDYVLYELGFFGRKNEGRINSILLKKNKMTSKELNYSETPEGQVSNISINENNQNHFNVQFMYKCN